MEAKVLSYIRLHTRTAKINEILQKWRYIHCLQHCTFVPGHVSSQWDGIHCTLPPRKKHREEGTVNYTDRGNGPTGRGREMKRCNYGEETEECWNQGRAGQSFVSEGESTFPRVSLLLNQEQHLITTLQTTWGL